MANVTLVDLAEAGDLPELRRRVDAGDDVNARGPDGRIALHAAVAEGMFEVVQFLLEHGADAGLVDATGYGVLHWAARANSRAMLELARDVSKLPVDVLDLEGRTPLSGAAQANDSIAIDWLLENGADPNRVESDGWAPLHFAAADGHVEAIQRLLHAGAIALLRLTPEPGEDYGHLGSDLARHYATHRPEAVTLLQAAEAAEAEELGQN